MNKIENYIILKNKEFTSKYNVTIGYNIRCDKDSYDLRLRHNEFMLSISLSRESLINNHEYTIDYFLEAGLKNFGIDKKLLRKKQTFKEEMERILAYE